MMLDKDLRYALDPMGFAAECIGVIPDPWQAEVLRSGEKRVILNCCRQSGKSTTAAIKALHRAIYYKKSLVLLISPSLRQSGELFRKVTDFLKLLPDKPRLVQENRLSIELENGSRVVSLPGSEETVRGYSSVDLIVEDEAARVSNELYRAIRPMLAVSGGRLVLMSTPFGKRGHFYEEYMNGNNWKKVLVTANDCPRISQEHLEAERTSLGEHWFNQEYFCKFVEGENQLFAYDLVKEAIDNEVSPIPIF